MDSNPVAWFEIYIQDMDRSKRFYEAMLQVTLRKLEAPAGDMELWAFPADMNGYGASGALVRMSGVPSGGNSTIVYFHCEDCAVEEGRVEPSGGRVERSKMAIGAYGHISLVRDTEGNLVGLHSMA
jgi:uncharacterized protein